MTLVYVYIHHIHAYSFHGSQHPHIGVQANATNTREEVASYILISRSLKPTYTCARNVVHAANIQDKVVYTYFTYILIPRSLKRTYTHAGNTVHAANIREQVGHGARAEEIAGNHD